MPKRTAQERIEHYQRKIRKLEMKENNRIGTENGPVEETISETEDQAPVVVEETSTPTIVACTASADDVSVSATGAPTATAAAGGASMSPEEENAQLQNMPAPDPPLDPDLLSALGESTSDLPEFGEKVHENLASLWLPLLKKGMPKDAKDKLTKEYLVPDNCRLLQSPKLNPEISAAVPDMVRNRDKNVMAYQQQLGSAITAVNRAMDILLKSGEKVQALKHLSNGCRVLSDLHYMSTQSRIKLITPSLDKTFLNVIQDGERDDTLFGNKLSEKIKAAKAIEKQGLQIKKTTQKSSGSSQTTAPRPAYQGNYQAPPRYPSMNRGGRGGFTKPFQLRRPYPAPPPPPPPPPKSASHNKPRHAGARS